jgi:hypothetical protein
MTAEGEGERDPIVMEGRAAKRPSSPPTEDSIIARTLQGEFCHARRRAPSRCDV